MKEKFNVTIEVVSHEKGIIYDEDMTILFKIEVKVNDTLKETFYIGSDDVNQKPSRFIELLWDEYRDAIDELSELNLDLLFSNECAFTEHMHKIIMDYCKEKSVPPHYLSEHFNVKHECYPCLAEAIYKNITTDGFPYVNEFNKYNKHTNIKWTYENSTLRLTNEYLNKDYELKEPSMRLLGAIAVDYNKEFNNIIDGRYNWNL